MLTPEYLEDLPEEILQLFYEVEQEILADMARRVSTYDYWIPAAEYQRQKLREAGVLQEDILKSLSGITGRSEAELKRLMQEAGTKALQSDTAVYEAAGMTVPKIADSAPLRAILNAGYKATAQTMRNICKTTAHTATMQFENALDLAWMKVQSGAFDTDSAVRAAIKELSERGIQSIRYPSGRTDSIEVAVRRAVVTGVNQTAGQLQEELADELGCDLVEVSAHAGARPEHAKWQGKIYSRSGNDPKYPDFKKSTGYGTGAGLCGWNCRHTFGPYIEGSTPVWSEEQLAELDAPKYEYGGKMLTEYEASQQQRYNERQIRRWKREYVAMETAGLDTAESAVKLKHWQAVQDDFLSKTGFDRQYGREMTVGFGRNQASAAHVQAEEFYKNWSKSIGANDAIKTLAKYYAVKYNDSPRYELLRGYVRAVEKTDISPLIGFKEYERINRELRERVVGVMAGNGVIVESFATHFIDRVIGQTSTPHDGMRCGVPIEDVLDTLKNPKSLGAIRQFPDGDIRQTLIGRSSVVTVSIRDKRLIQTNPKGK